MAPPPACTPPSQPAWPATVDTAIIGGGVAGLYTAYRLSTAPIGRPNGRTLALFEATSRLGGRLCTARPPPAAPLANNNGRFDDDNEAISTSQGPRVDLGGMRFMRSQALVSALVRNVLAKRFADCVPIPFARYGSESVLYHLRGRTMSLADVEGGCHAARVNSGADSENDEGIGNIRGNEPRKETSHWKTNEGTTLDAAYPGIPQRFRGLSPDGLAIAVIREVLTADGIDLDSMQSVSRGKTHERWARLKETPLRFACDGPLHGRALHTLTLRHTFAALAGPGGADYVHDGSGYDSAGLWSAADGFEMFVDDYGVADGDEGEGGDGDKAQEEEKDEDCGKFTLKGGMQAIPDALASLAREAGVPMLTKARLEAFHRCEGAVADDGARYTLELWDARAEQLRVVRARNIVLALPRLALEGLEASLFRIARGLSQEKEAEEEDAVGDDAKLRDRPLSSSNGQAVHNGRVDCNGNGKEDRVQDESKSNVDCARLANDMRSVEIAPAVKVALWFDAPWWEGELGGPDGCVITDLPLRQAHFFGPERRDSREQGVGDDHDDRRCVVIATYSELEHVKYWKALQGNDAGPTDETSPEAQAQEGGVTTPSQPLIAELLSQLRTVFPATQIPPPAHAALKLWDGVRPGDGTACHLWAAGAVGWEVGPRMRAPLGKRVGVYVVGEAYSDRHGWVEGALCVAERVVRERFGLGAPDWMGKGDGGDEYFLGW